MGQNNSSLGRRKTPSRLSQRSDVGSHPSVGFFTNAQRFTINNSTFIDGNQSNDIHFMELLAKNKIAGAEFNSSERYPPPTCHPGTRLDILSHIRLWMHNVAREKKILWLNGPAGVGKSAITQAIADTESDSPASILGATLFFSRPNERDDPQRVFTTIAYQLAARYPQYRRYVVELLAQDPTLVNTSLIEQFKQFIVQPFTNGKLPRGLDNTVLILLDGLDECHDEDAQCEIISLISKFALQHPTSPLIWLIVSRPEPHIRTAFSSESVKASYQEIVLPVDSVQACLDVEQYLRDKFGEIQRQYSASFPSPTQPWPAESHFVKITARSSGLFIFPTLVIRFIRDREYANPITQLNKVLEVIDSAPSGHTPENPFATLDALYTQILSGIHRRILPIAMSILRICILHQLNFVLACNWLGVTQADAYGALEKLHSVLKIPTPEDAYEQALEPFHASFFDYLTSHTRSGAFFVDFLEAKQWHSSLCVRVLLESHNSDLSSIQIPLIKLSWPFGSHDTEIRADLYNRSFESLILATPESVNDTVRSNFNNLASFFQDLDFGQTDDSLPRYFRGHGLYSLLASSFAFQLEEWGILKTVALQSFNFDDIRLNQTIEIVKVYPSGEGPADKEIPEGNWDGTPPLFGNVLNNVSKATDWTQFEDSQGKTVICYTWVAKFVCLCEDSFWKAHVRERLSKLMSTMPSHAVSLFGKGEKSCALIRFEVPGEFWIYALPCVQP